MRALAIAVALAVLAAHGQSPQAAPTLQVDFSNPGLAPPQWTLTLHPDGSGHFSSRMGVRSPDAAKNLLPPAIDRDIHVSAPYAARVFQAARHQAWFNQDCESHLKVAFQGWKTLTYDGPQGHGSCTFNYSRDKEIQALGDSFEAVAETIVEGARLQMLLEHDPLGLDAEMEFLVGAANDGRAQQIVTIRGILERLAQDENVLERVRKRASLLLAHEPT